MAHQTVGGDLVQAQRHGIIAQGQLVFIERRDKKPSLPDVN